MKTRLTDLHARIALGLIFLSLNGAYLSAISKKLLLKFSYWEFTSEFGSISQFILSRSHKKCCSSKFLKLLHLEYLGLEFGLSYLTSMAITLWQSLSPQPKLQIFPHFLSWFVKIKSMRVGLKFLLKHVAFLPDF